MKCALIEYAKDDAQRALALCDKMVNDCFASEDYRKGRRRLRRSANWCFRESKNK